jgi:hypothetical protein
MSVQNGNTQTEGKAANTAHTTWLINYAIDSLPEHSVASFYIFQKKTSLHSINRRYNGSVNWNSKTAVQFGLVTVCHIKANITRNVFDT